MSGEPHSEFGDGGVWYEVGHVSVHSDQICIIDPAYGGDLAYDAACQVTANGGGMLDVGKHGTAIVTESGVGDGRYPVFARLREMDEVGAGERVVELRVLLDVE